MSEACEQIAELIATSRERQAYFDGHRDGALALLAEALGIEGAVGNRLFGYAFRLSLEWADPPDEKDLVVIRRFVEQALERSREHGL